MDPADRILSCLSSALNPGGNNARVAETLAGELDVARSTAAAIDTVRNPDLTTGRTLDYVAQMFNVARTSGESDDSLRSRITTQIKRYYSCGTLTDIRDIIEYFTGLTGDRVRIREPPDVHEGWGYGEGRYGSLPWGTPHAMFRVELLGDDHTAIMLPGLVAAIDLVRAAGVYVQDLVICSTLQEVLVAAEGSILWVVPAPLRSGFGTCGYGTCGYGGVYTIRSTAEGAVDLVVEPTAAVTAQAASYLGYGAWRYGQYEFGY